ncbi:unnamed protein product [Cyclocybe aegerita]|uniref:Uncharacterized protein n=1 Tax=Cyclocybe aegerita TaxID=1973307 RepID=A0A8S0W4A4_CYCAE|nr:unnamed protein product [Cyclocybe aegerita]
MAPQDHKKGERTLTLSQRLFSLPPMPLPFNRDVGGGMKPPPLCLSPFPLSLALPPPPAGATLPPICGTNDSGEGRTKDGGKGRPEGEERMMTHGQQMAMTNNGWWTTTTNDSGG